MKPDRSNGWLQRASHRLTLAAALAFGLALVSSGCGGGGDDERPMPAAPSASASIGPAGGTLVGPDDVRVEVPPGALAEVTTITVTRSSAGAPALPASAAGHQPMYEFTPHGLKFAVPVTISMPSTLDPVIDPVFMAQPGEGWVRVDSAVANGRVAWPSSHFSWSYQFTCSAAYPPGTPLPANPVACQFPSAAAVVTAVPAAAMGPRMLDQVYHVSAEADVTVSFRYSAPLDCINPTIRTGRGRLNGYVDPATLPVTPVAMTRTPAPDAAGYDRLAGSTDFTYHFGPADTGSNPAVFLFSCQGGFSAGGGVLFNVQIAQPPAAPAAPTITTQPMSRSVEVGVTATFDVLATAPDNLVVRWQRKDAGASAFAAVSGAAPITGGSRLAVMAQAVDNGSAFRGQVCNSLGGVDNCVYTSTATLTVTLPPPPAGALAANSRLGGAFLSTCGISQSGGVLCWGANGYGELGRGSTPPAEGAPATATGLTGVTSVGASSFIGCAIHSGGRLACWGSYPGVGRGEQSAVPASVAGVIDAKLVRVANGVFCTVDGDRRIRCSDITGPLQIDGQVVDDAIDVAFHGAGRCVLLASGDARCAMYDGTARLVTARVVPMVRSLGGVPGYSGVGVPFCVVLQSGAVRCWGSNVNGQLGTGNADLSIDDLAIPGIGTAVQVAVGTRHACAVLADGTVSCWGSGYLGNGAGVELSKAPRSVSGLTGIVEITAGYDTTCALRADGAVLCWGDNASGSIGIGSLGPAVLVPTPTVAGDVFAR
ncbi:MAG: hypothetical protein ABI281_12455 [Caldimonas sp.]